MNILSDSMMKTLKLTENELATIKAVLYTHIQQMKREKQNGANVDDLLEQYEQAFEALSFAQ
ncbi:hypothetical protein [Anoxybacillus flavithermus]|uniref:Uncharacterized protein n=1 Tax=Anoxybacillus flavithermus TaxID=33934 RepID=A0A178THV5_9BACL|nr:hypothetical protein [Anoxybacillus flavithermus]OAO80933.1 hypothetical protein TAF16_0872 [Anoxybacillus flavithermus]